LICRAFLDRDDAVLLECPTYAGALRAFVASEVQFFTIPLDCDGLVVDAAEQRLTELRSAGVRPKLLYLIPNFQNPSGVCTTLERRERLVHLAERFGFLIVEDDAYGELRYNGNDIRSFYSLDTSGVVIRLGTFSKTLAPGLRLGWILSSPEVVARFSDVKIDTGSSPLSSFIAESYCRGGRLDPHVEHLKTVYGQRRDAMLDSLSRHAPSSVRWSKPDGGFFVWLQCPDWVDTSALLQRAIEHRVAYLPGKYCFADGQGAAYMRLSFSCVSSQDAEEGVRRLCEVLTQEMHGGSARSVDRKSE
jgi:2-aminoadipate transaminase